MGGALCQIVCMKAREIANVIRVKHPALSFGPQQLFFVRAATHSCLCNAYYVNGAGTQTARESAAHGILIEIEADLRHAGSAGVLETTSQNASSSAMSASI